MYSPYERKLLVVYHSIFPENMQDDENMLILENAYCRILQHTGTAVPVGYNLYALYRTVPVSKPSSSHRQASRNTTD